MLPVREPGAGEAAMLGRLPVSNNPQGDRCAVCACVPV
jgi:hypothetical protein